MTFSPRRPAPTADIADVVATGPVLRVGIERASLTPLAASGRYFVTILALCQWGDD